MCICICYLEGVCLEQEKPLFFPQLVNLQYLRSKRSQLQGKYHAEAYKEEHKGGVELQNKHTRKKYTQLSQRRGEDYIKKIKCF